MTTEIIEYSRTEAALAELRERHAIVITNDPATTKGMAALKEFRATVRGLRTSLEAERKRIKEPALERCRLIDSEAKRITAELLKVEEPTDEIIKAEEARKAAIKAEQERIERERVAGIQQKIYELANWPQRAIGKTAAEMKDMLAELSGFVPTADVYAEFIEQAEAAVRAAIEKLADMTQAAVEQEEAKRAAAEEAARLKAERDRVAAELAEQRRIQAAERAAHDAEMAKLAAERKALEDQRAAAEAAERNRLQDIADAERLAKVVAPKVIYESVADAELSEASMGPAAIIPMRKRPEIDAKAITWAISKLMERRVHLESVEATKMIDRLAYMVTPDWQEAAR